MKVNYENGIYIIYLKNYYNSPDEICRYIKSKLNKIYRKDITGIFDVIIYYDKKYGNIVEMKKIDDYFTFDFHIINKEVSLLIMIDDILDIDLDEYYYYKNNFYVDYNENLFGKVIYKDLDKIKGCKCVKFTIT